MAIDRSLNLAFPVDTRRGEVWVHSTPLSRAVFERYYMVMGHAFAITVEIGGALIAGPRVAALSLRDAAKRMGIWEGEGGVELGLLPEIHRLTNVIVPVPEGGWQTMPLPDAHKAQILNDDDFAEVEGTVVFFMLGSALMPGADLATMRNGLASRLSAQITSSNSTVFKDSLPKSTATGSSGATALIS